jgi:ABC-2 type transport system permease protein
LVVTLAVNLFAPPEAGQRLRGITLSGFILSIFLSHSIWVVGLGLHKEKTEGTLTGLYLTPASRFLTLLARAIIVLIWTGLAGGLGLLLARLVVGPFYFHNIGLALVILGCTISSLIGLSFAMAALALRSGESVELLANLLEFGLMGVCAFFFPFSVLPPPLLTVARFIPLSYAVDAFRTVTLNAPRPELLSLQAELVIVAAFGIAGPLLGYAFYLASETKARRQGIF